MSLRINVYDWIFTRHLKAFITFRKTQASVTTKQERDNRTTYDNDINDSPARYFTFDRAFIYYIFFLKPNIMAVKNQRYLHGTGRVSRKFQQPPFTFNYSFDPLKSTTSFRRLWWNELDSEMISISDFFLLLVNDMNFDKLDSPDDWRMAVFWWNCFFGVSTVSSK